jgi:hypothetical protein
MEHVSDAVALEHIGEAFRPTHFTIVSEHDRPFRRQKLRFAKKHILAQKDMVPATIDRDTSDAGSAA